MRYLYVAGLMLAMALHPVYSAAGAPAYPTRPITLVVPFAPGGGADHIARRIAAPLSARLGQPIVIDNRPGGGGTLGAAAVAKAKPDGYTLLYATPGQQMTLPHLMDKLPYDPEHDFAAISPLLRGVSVLVVHKDVPANSVQELIDLAKARPGELSFASAGIGASSHLAGALFQHMAGLDIVHVPYRGSGAAVTDVASGRVEMAIDTISVYQPHITSGSVKPLGVSSLKATPVLPGVPPMADDLEGFDASPVNYITAPAGTPPDIIARLNREINEVLEMPEIIDFFQQVGADSQGGTPEDLEALIRSESEKWKTVIQASGASSS